MADRTSAGRESTDKSRLAARRIQLQIHQNQGSIMQAELDIDNSLEQIELRKKQIAATEEQNAKLAEELKRMTVEMTGKE